MENRGVSITIVWIFVSPQNSYVDILIPKYDGSRGEPLGGDSRHGWDCCPYERPVELATSFCQVRTQRKEASYEPERGSSPKCDHACALILDFSLQNTRNKCLLFKSHAVYGVMI